MARTNPLGVRVELEIKVALEKAAAADDRSVSSLVERILRGWLVEHGHLPADPGASPPQVTPATRQTIGRPTGRAR